jgi:acyl carrier protein phosphodiesterase
MDGAEYMQVDLGLIFLKYVLDTLNEVRTMIENQKDSFSDLEDRYE